MLVSKQVQRTPMQVAAFPAVARDTAPCPRCGATMVLAAVTRHPIATQMQRHTYLCQPCNQTKTYILPGT